MKKRILSTLFCFGIIATIFPATFITAHAEGGVYVGEQEVTDGGYWTYSSEAWSSGSASDYNVHYDKDTATLTLKDLTYEGKGKDGEYNVVSSEENITIALEGENSITTADCDDEETGNNYGIFVTGNLTLTGSGSLTATSGAVTKVGQTVSYGICATGTTTITDGTTVTGFGGSVTGSYKNMSTTAGIYSGGLLTIENGAILNGTGGTANDYTNSYGVYARGAFTALGTVNGTGGDSVCDSSGSDTSSAGVITFGVTNIAEGAEVTANGGKGSYVTSYGMFTASALTVYGTLTATGGSDITNGGKGSYGLYANGAFTAESGADVTATGGGNLYRAPNYGIYAAKSITVKENAVVEASCGENYVYGNSNNKSYGVQFDGILTVEGELYATSGKSFSDSYGIRGGYTDGNVISGTVTATGGISTDDDIYGAYIGGETTVTGTFTAIGSKSEDSYGHSMGFYASELIVDGTVTATAGDAGAESTGMRNDLSLTINDGGVVNVKSGNATKYTSTALYVNTSGLTLKKGATLNAEGGAGNPGCGIYIFTYSTSYKGTVIVNGGTLTAKDNAAGGYGICNEGDFNIFSGNTAIYGAEAAIKNGGSNLAVDDTLTVSVGTNANGSDAAAWDKTTELTTYKYIKTEGGAEAYGVYVGDKLINSDNADDVYNDGKVSYDNETQTLTLTDYTYSGLGYSGKYKCILSEHDLNLVLNGENSVSCVTDDTVSQSVGIWVDGNLNVSGSGTLTAKGGEAISSSYGIRVTERTVFDGGTIIAEAGNTQLYSYGMFISSNLTVNEGVSILATGKDATKAGSQSSGICIDSSTIYVRGGSITANSGTALAWSEAIDGDLNISSGSVTATAGSAGVRASGIVGTVTISGGTVTANGGTVTFSYNWSDTYASTGLAGKLTMSGGSLTANGGAIKKSDDYIESSATGTYGIRTSGAVNITGGTVVAKGGTLEDGLTASDGIRAVKAGTFTTGKGVTVRAGSSESDAAVIDDFSTNSLAAYMYLTSDYTPYTILSIADAKVSSADKGTLYWKNKTGNDGLTAEGASEDDYNVSFDTQTRTLTLNGFNFAGNGTSDAKGRYGIAYTESNDITVILKGENSITISDATAPVTGEEYTGDTNGIYAMYFGGTAEFDGDGSLTVKSGKAYYGSSVGIRTNGSMHFGGSVNVSITSADCGGDTENEVVSAAIDTNKSALSVGNGATVTANGGSVVSGRSAGAFAGNIYNAGTLNVRGGNVTTGTSYGVSLSPMYPDTDTSTFYAYIYVQDGTLTAEGGSGTQSYGVNGKSINYIYVTGKAYFKTGNESPNEASAIKIGDQESVTAYIPETYAVRGSTVSGTEQDTVITDSGNSSAVIGTQYRYVEFKKLFGDDAEFTIEYTETGAKITNTSDFGCNTAVIVAYYDANNALSEITFDEKTTFTADEVYNVTADKTKGDYKVFVWNSLDGIRPLDINRNNG